MSTREDTPPFIHMKHKIIQTSRYRLSLTILGSLQSLTMSNNRKSEGREVLGQLCLF